MNRATPRMRIFAESLLLCERNAGKSSDANLPETLRVCEKLRTTLASMTGHSGFRALLSRALVLTEAEVPWLRTVRPDAHGSLDGLHEIQEQVHPNEIAAGGLVLIAELLGLLVAFIGEGLTLQLLREVWPKVSLEDLGVENGDNHEKEK